MNQQSHQFLTFQKINPSEVGMNDAKINDMHQIISSVYKNLTGIIILRHDQLVFEHYYHGYGKDDQFHVASVTKSILSALIGIAVEKGYIKSLDQKVLDYFPEYSCHPSEIQKKAITIRHLLTMRAPYLFRTFHEPLEKLVRQKDWICFSLDMLGKNGRIGEFKYSSCGAHLLSVILSRATGQSAREFANQYLFAPLGMNIVEDNPDQSFDAEGLFGKKLKGWAKDPQGYSTGGWGLKLTTRDMARFGSLYLHDGLMNQQHILSKSWIHDSIEGISIENLSLPFNYYGYLWCIYRKKGIYAYMAMGDGGNVICCIPQEHLVVAISSETMRKPRDRWELIEKYILPAIESKNTG